MGEGLARGSAPVESCPQVMEAFWAANTQDRRALAHVVAGLTAKGRVKGELLLAALRSFPAALGARAEQEKVPLTASDGKSEQIIAADRPRE